MSDKDKAKNMLMYGDKMIEVKNLPKGLISNVDYSQRRDLSMFKTFEQDFLMTHEEKMDDMFVEINLSVKFIGKLKDLKYIIQSQNQKCSIVPRNDDE